MKRWPVFLTMVIFSGCSLRDHSVVEQIPDTRLTATNGVSFLAPADWWLVHTANHRTIRLTADGLDIDEITFQTLYPGDMYYGSHEGPPKVDEENALVFHTYMNAEDICAMQIEKLRREGARQANCSTPTTLAFGKNDGFRFDYSFTDENGLRRRGRATGALRGGGLDLLIYEAPVSYYFKRHEAEAEMTARSLRTP